MSSKRKDLKGMNGAEQTHELARRVRGSWNGVNPVTKVYRDRTKYNRKQKHKNRDVSDAFRSAGHPCFISVPCSF